jgi:[ribosomal protein S5]-alanine N-acetyltransferase
LQAIVQDSNVSIHHGFTMILQTERMIIRTAQPEDITAILGYWSENRAFLQTWEPLRPEIFFTESFWTRQVVQDQQDWKNDRALKLFLFPKIDALRVIGTINFSEIIRGGFQSCFLGFALDRNYQGSGTMFEALQVSINYVFSEMKLHRIQANFIPRNIRSEKLLKRLGFSVEGYAQDYLRINGKWEDHILTSLINRAWIP